MRSSQAHSALLATVAALLSTANIAAASGVYALVHDSVVLVQRQNGACAKRCGYYLQICCTADQTCFTDANNQAQCGYINGAGVTAAGGYWEYTTSTWVETDLVTRTQVYSSYVGAPAAATPTQGCSIPCGPSCCGTGQYCLNTDSGVCANQGGTTGAVPAPTTRAIISPTTTVPIMSATPAGQTSAESTTGGGGGGLSGGAIAGIVIGVLAGIFLLALLCLFCCAKTIFDSLLALLGMGKKKRRTEETYIETHHSHHGGGGGRQSWYGQGPARPPKEEKKSKFGGLGGMGAALGGLALVLGLKRRHDRKHEEKSDYSSRSSDYYSDYTSSSSASSSDRRTRQTRQSSRH